MGAGVLGQDSANSDFQSWVAGTERKLPAKGLDRQFSANTIWIAKAKDSTEVVLKCFGDTASFNVERAAYRALQGRYMAVDHFVGEARFRSRPTLVLRRLSPLNWTGPKWKALLTGALELRRLLSSLGLRAMKTEGPIPTVNADVLFEPFRRWNREREFSSALSEVVKGCEQVPLELCHGDFHPPNILGGSAGRLQLVDWERCAWSPLERDLAAIAVGVAVRRPIGELNTITAMVSADALYPKLLTYLIISEMLALLELFSDDTGMIDTLDQMMVEFMKNAKKQGMI